MSKGRKCTATCFVSDDWALTTLIILTPTTLVVVFFKNIFIILY